MYVFTLLPFTLTFTPHSLLPLLLYLGHLSLSSLRAGLFSFLFFSLSRLLWRRQRITRRKLTQEKREKGQEKAVQQCVRYEKGLGRRLRRPDNTTPVSVRFPQSVTMGNNGTLYTFITGTLILHKNTHVYTITSTDLILLINGDLFIQSGLDSMWYETPLVNLM